MQASLSILQILGLILAGIVAGAALLILVMGRLASASGDDAGSGCSSIGLMLLAFAAVVAIKVL